MYGNQSHPMRTETMENYCVYRYGSNAANQSMNNGPCLVAKVEAKDELEACELAAQRVSVYNGQHLEAELASEVEAREADIDERVDTDV